MARFILPIILIAISITGFLVFTNPLFSQISDLRAKQASYDQALANSKALQDERDKLTQKYNAITPDNLDKLQKLLPDNVDNIRLILEIGQIAAPYGMVLKDVKYNTAPDTTSTTAQNGVVQGGTVTTAPQDYGAWDLQFTTSGTYDNFINFVKDIESNLRIVDISNVDFSSADTTTAPTTTSQPVYQYKLTIKTYWLKN